MIDEMFDVELNCYVPHKKPLDESFIFVEGKEEGSFLACPRGEKQQRQMEDTGRLLSE